MIFEFLSFFGCRRGPSTQQDYTGRVTTARRGSPTASASRKIDVRVEACGAVDETNSLLRLLSREATYRTRFALRSSACSTSCSRSRRDRVAGLREDRVRARADLERDLDALNAALPPLKEFVLPGGNRPPRLSSRAQRLPAR